MIEPLDLQILGLIGSRKTYAPDQSPETTPTLSREEKGQESYLFSVPLARTALDNPIVFSTSNLGVL